MRIKKFKKKTKRGSNILVASVLAVISLMGISYGYWSDSLMVNANISTGKLRVEGVNSYDQYHEYPTHDSSGSDGCPEGNACTFKDWWQQQEQAGIVDLNNGIANQSPIKVTNLTMQAEMDTTYNKITYSGIGDIEFTIKNLGTIPAEVSLYKDTQNHRYKKTWIKLSAPYIGNSSSRATLAQEYIDVANKTFDVKIEDGESSREKKGVNHFVFNPGEVAIITLKGCELDVLRDRFNNPDYEPNQLDLEALRIEAQVSIYFKDSTGSWYDNTCNSIFTNREVGSGDSISYPQPTGCSVCSPKCKAYYTGPECNNSCKESHCNGFCPCFKQNRPENPVINEDINNANQGTRPVLPEVQPLPIPMPLPEVQPLPMPMPLPEVQPLPIPVQPDENTEVTEETIDQDIVQDTNQGIIQETTVPEEVPEEETVVPEEVIAEEAEEIVVSEE